MSDKYIKVSDLEKCTHNYYGSLEGVKNQIRIIIDSAQEMVSVDEVKRLKTLLEETYQANTLLTTYKYMQLQLTNLISPQSEWEKLSKLAYIFVEMNNGDITNIKKLDSFESIHILLPDPENMERTNTDIPDGIKTMVLTGIRGYEVTTPFDTYDKNNMKHYRILGTADE